MDLYKLLFIIKIIIINCVLIKCESNNTKGLTNPDNVFNGVYTECFFHLSYSCLQKKTLLYLKELNNLSEVSVIGDYVKFVKVNASSTQDDVVTGSTDELAFLIDKAVDDFFSNHVLKFNALGRDISIPRNVEEFEGRKKRKGGGGGEHGHDDGGKKKMMMMAMMCMKMKLMMMVPAMMGMMGMMSFKGMMFSMMSFMISKMMLLMKILEKKGGAGGIGGGAGGDGGWAASGGGGGAWMPAGGQDFGGAGGGYDANGQWQSRSIVDHPESHTPPSLKDIEADKPKPYEIATDLSKYQKSWLDNSFHLKSYGKSQEKDYKTAEFYTKPEVSFVKSSVRFNNDLEVSKDPVLVYKKSNVDFSNYADDNTETDDAKKATLVLSRSKRNVNEIASDDTIDSLNQSNKDSTTKGKRKKRSILDILQNSYSYWMNKLLGVNNNRRTNFQRYKVINGVRYVYYPLRQRVKTPKEVQLTAIKAEPLAAEDFNKGEIMDGAVVESRMNKKKFHKIKDTVNDTVEENPWE